VFSPADEWFRAEDNGEAQEFAIGMLVEVRELLSRMADELEGGSRRQRRRNAQAALDLRDAATTISDAVRFLCRGELGLSPEDASSLVASVLEDYPQVHRGRAVGVATSLAQRLDDWSMSKYGLPWLRRD